MNSRRQESLARVALGSAACLTVAVMLAITGQVLASGLSHVSPAFLLEAPRSMGREGGILPTIISTAYLTTVALAVASPLSIGAAVYLAEYARRGRLVQGIRFATESLAGVPSIIFGLFGFSVFVLKLGMGWSVLSGGLTLALMILPTMVRATEEALQSVPARYREGSLALGASRWQTVTRVVLPSALPGIATGVILSVGRAVGETAAVLLTAGSALGVPQSLGDPARSMAVHLYILASEGISMDRAYATGSVLVILVVLVNAATNYLGRRRVPGRRKHAWSRPSSSA
ncbi:MAG: phosphate ABC transporter permease PstA [Bacillota bacterium]